MNEHNITSDLLRGHTDTIILGLLNEGDKYGYEISKLVYKNSNRTYELKEATMYSSLRRLEADMCITSYWGDESHGGRRKYYRITPRGVRLQKANRANWDYAKKTLDKLL